MTSLKPIKAKWLAKFLDPLVDAINARSISVSTGGGIDLQESTTGVLISLSTGSGTTKKSQDAGSILTQLQIDTLTALISPPSSPVSGTFYPFSSGGVAQSEGWLGVTTVDPTTCVQKIISVWAANPSP